MIFFYSRPTTTYFLLPQHPQQMQETNLINIPKTSINIISEHISKPMLNGLADL